MSALCKSCRACRLANTLNWGHVLCAAGNYVTVQEWNDLALKEGLTTYMEQAFAADMDTAEAAAMGMIKPRLAFKAPACKAPTDGSITAAEQAEAAAAGLLPLPELLPYLRGVAACRGGRGGCPDGVQDIEAAGFYWRRIADVAYLRKYQVGLQLGSFGRSCAQPCGAQFHQLEGLLC